MKKSKGILPNAKEHLAFVIIVIFASLFLIKNVFFSKNLNNDIITYKVFLKKRRFYDTKTTW